VDDAKWLEAVFISIPLVWFFGGVGGLAWTLAGYARFCRRVNRTAPCEDARLLRLWSECCKVAGVRRAGRIVIFDGVEQPAIMGIWRSTLLLPSDTTELDDAEIRMIMLHELAHVRRWDIVANWALVAIRAIHWWNPVYWLAAARFRSLREQACDAYVIRVTENQPTHSYGQLLLALAERRPSGSTWRVVLPASILTFFPSAFRRHSVRVRLNALRRAGMRPRWWQAAGVAALLVALVVSGFTTANQPEEKPVDLPTWMASHPAAVLAPKRSYEVQEDFSGPREIREYDIALCLDRIADEPASEDEARQLFEATLKLLYFRALIDKDEVVRSHPVKPNEADRKEHVDEKVSEAAAPPPYTISGTTLRVTAPAAVHERLRHTLDAWSESGLAQITVETRFLSANRDLVSELGISWQFLEAFSSVRESAFPTAGRDGAPVVRAEAHVDEYLPLVVSTLSKEQAARLIGLAQGDRRTNVLQAPKVTIFNGQEAMIVDCTQRPFVVGVFQRVAGANEPKVVVLEEGTKINVRGVQSQDRKKVHLEASLDMRALGDVTTASTSYRGGQVSIQVPSVNRRSIDVAADIEDGQTLLVGCIPTGKQQQYTYYLLSASGISQATKPATTPPSEQE
jgi:bla regulator protein blaR1